MGTLDSFLIGSREADVAGAQSTLEVRGMNDTHIGCRSSSHYGHQYVWGLGPRNQHVLGTIPFWPDMMFEVIRDCH